MNVVSDTMHFIFYKRKVLYVCQQFGNLFVAAVLILISVFYNYIRFSERSLLIKNRSTVALKPYVYTWRFAYTAML